MEDRTCSCALRPPSSQRLKALLHKAASAPQILGSRSKSCPLSHGQIQPKGGGYPKKMGGGGVTPHFHPVLIWYLESSDPHMGSCKQNAPQHLGGLIVGCMSPFVGHGAFRYQLGLVVYPTIYRAARGFGSYTANPVLRQVACRRIESCWTLSTINKPMIQ